MIYYIFETCAGWAGIAGGEGLISRLVLPSANRIEIEDILKMEGYTESLVEFSDRSDEIAGYFAGEKVVFDFPLDYTGVSLFDKAVWEAARKIPYGETASYRHLARLIGRPYAARAVGGSMSRNRIPIIIPCHRIVRSDGGLGGFSAGLDWKKRLLALEKHTCKW